MSLLINSVLKRYHIFTRASNYLFGITIYRCVDIGESKVLYILIYSDPCRSCEISIESVDAQRRTVG